ncbi:AAA family ATPase [Clostridium cuniculi]|uniref:AAA family ATPase n=1 Tax=Clostridium cuniculi TaxID=2548455 RepID=UPI00105582FD|nr:AAA family ATPase [Clostridium cuniculi]
MYLKNIKISNFKAIDNTEINFKKGFNIIIGNNGVGKTSILEAISVALGGFLGGIDGVNTKHFTKDEIRCVSELLGQGSYNIKYITPIKVECNVELDDKDYTWTRKKNSIKASKSTIEPRDICRKAGELSGNSNAILPILNYQSVARMWAQKREKTQNVFKSDNFSRNVGYVDCLSQESNNKLLLNWCRKMEQVSWQEDQKIAEYEAVKNSLAKFMSIMNDSNVNKVLYDKKREELMYREGEKILPIGLLSAGYQSLIWMVLEIAYRMAVLNPNLLDEVTEITPGIVLIDELDLHLHPKWQWKIVESLEKTFPNVQFIATTHSPIILASCKDDSILTINSDMSIDYKKSSYGLQVNDVLSVYQQSNNIALNIKSKLDKFNEFISCQRYADAKEVLDLLTKELGDDNPEVISARITMDLETLDLED